MAAQNPCGRPIHANRGASCARPTHAHRGRLSEAERLHRHNEEMRLALAEGLSLAEARWRLFEQRMEQADQARDQRLARIDEENRQRRDGRLGVDAREARFDDSPDHRPRFWWEDRD